MRTEIRFTYASADGKTRIHAVKWLPEDGKYHAIVQIVHGMIEHCFRYKDFARFLNSKGIMVVAHDHLGHGDSVRSEKYYGYFCENNPSRVLVEDIHRLRRITKKANPGVPYFMLGHSMGSYLLRRYLSTYPEGLSGAIIMGTGYVPKAKCRMGLQLMKRIALRKGWFYNGNVLPMLVFSGSYWKFDLSGKDLERSWLTKDKEMLLKHADDPKCNFNFTVNGYYALISTVYYDEQMKNIEKIPKDLPLLIVSGEDDPVGDLSKGVRIVYELYNRAGIEDINYYLYENDRHEILNETDRDVVYDDIYRWVEKKQGNEVD
ncbi:MAG: lysophospholipase [Lachnospiraceae bacterium]|nr:lysophospholipase [Lachnospiraceae bacterium]